MSNSPDTRVSLILKLQSKDNSQVWDEFVSLYQSVIYRTARKQGLNHDDAAEVTQEVMARVTKSIDDWEHDPSKGSFRGWLYRITKNLAIDFLRKSNRRPSTGRDTAVFQSLEDRSSQSLDDFDRQLERQIFRQTAQRIKSQFKRRTWDAFWQTAVEGKSVEEIASKLKMTRGAVYISRSRVMARLKQEVQRSLDQTIYGETER